MEFIVLIIKNLSFFLVFGALFFGLSVGLAFLLNFLTKTRQPKNIRHVTEKNPYIYGVPIKSETKEMFFGREYIFQWIQENLSAKELMYLYGPRRTGKTSVGMQLENRLGRKCISVFFDIQSVYDPGTDVFFSELANAVAEAFNHSEIEITVPCLKDFSERPCEVFRDDFIPKVEEKLNDKTLLFFFDEIEEFEPKIDRGELDIAAFLKTLSEIVKNKKNIQFIFSGRILFEEVQQKILGSSFTIIPKELGFLSSKETRPLITEPVKQFEYENTAIEYIQNLTAGHPLFTQLVCHTIFEYQIQKRSSVITAEDVALVINDIFSKGEIDFNLIWKDSSEDEHHVLMHLANKIDDADYQASLDNLVNQMKGILDPQVVTNALNSLVKKSILSKSGPDENPQYSFTVELVRRWICRTKPEV